MIKFLIVILAAIYLGNRPAQAAASSTPVPILIKGKLTLVVTPATPTITCDIPGGSVVAELSTTGGNSKPVTYSITGDTIDFAIGTNPANNNPALVVNPAGITSENYICSAIPPMGAVTAVVNIKPDQ